MAVGADGHVSQIHDSPLRLGRSGRATVTKVRGATWDAATGMLVISGDGAVVEVYDPERMQSRGVCNLECSNVDHGMCATDGVAWIPTIDGTLIHFDVASKRATGRTVVADGTSRRVRTSVGIGATGRHLIAAAGERIGDDDHGTGAWQTTLRVFRIEGGTLECVAAVTARLTQAINEVTLLEKDRVVVVSTPGFVLAWHYDRASR